jgi:hypothetical protein
MLVRGTLVLLLAAAGAAAQFGPMQSVKLTGDFYLKSFGQAVATDGTRVVVGSPFESLDRGRVYVYLRIGGRWELEDSFQPDVPALLDNFGAAVDIDGDLIAVGAPGESPNSNGKGFVFRRTGSDWLQELVVQGESLADNLGTDVGVHGDMVAFGSPGDDDVVAAGGAIHVYRHDGTAWGFEEKLRPVGGAANGSIGARLAVAEDRLLAGGFTGAAHLYRRSGGAWGVEQTLTGDIGPASDFGRALALDEGLALVGAPAEALGEAAFGAAYVFRLQCDTWVREAKLVSPQPGIGQFGAAVDIDGRLLVVGDSLADDLGPSAGAAFAWRRDGIAWNLEQTFVPDDLAAGDRFGWSVGAGGDVVIVGSVEDDDIAPNSGAAYVFEGAPVHEPWTDLGFALPGAAGAPSLAGGGSLLVGEPVQVSLRCGPAHAPATLVTGFSVLAAPFKGGVMVPHPNLSIALVLDASGASVLAAAWPPGAPSGFSFALQAWITDGAGPAGFSATNGVLGSVP